jgi:F-type H+-transporting ATPase subunit b
MFVLSGTYVIFIVLFLVFMFLLNETVLKPVGAVIEKRKARAAGDYEVARTCAAEGEAVVSRYQTHIHEVRSQAQKILHESVAVAQKKRDEKLKQIQADGNNKVSRVRAELAAQREALIKTLVEPELDLVKEISEKLLTAPITISISRESVQRALEEAR